VRLHPEIRQGTLELAENCQITRDDLVETVFAALFGSKDEVGQQKLDQQNYQVVFSSPLNNRHV